MAAGGAGVDGHQPVVAGRIARSAVALAFTHDQEISDAGEAGDVGAWRALATGVEGGKQLVGEGVDGPDLALAGHEDGGVVTGVDEGLDLAAGEVLLEVEALQAVKQGGGADDIVEHAVALADKLDAGAGEHCGHVGNGFELRGVAVDQGGVAFDEVALRGDGLVGQLADELPADLAECSFGQCLLEISQGLQATAFAGVDDVRRGVADGDAGGRAREGLEVHPLAAGQDGADDQIGPVIAGRRECRGQQRHIALAVLRQAILAQQVGCRHLAIDRDGRREGGGRDGLGTAIHRDGFELDLYKLRHPEAVLHALAICGLRGNDGDH